MVVFNEHERAEIAIKVFVGLAATMPRNLDQAAYLAVIGTDKLIKQLNTPIEEDK